MSTNAQVVVLRALVRLAGPQCVRDADALVDVAMDQRPKVIGRAIAQHGRADPYVRAMVRGLDLPRMLEHELTERAACAARQTEDDEHA